MAGVRLYRPRKNQGLYSGNLVGFDLGKPIAMFAYVENNGPCFSGFSGRSEPVDLYLCVHVQKDKDQGPCSNGQVGRKGGRHGAHSGHIPPCSAFCSTQARSRWEDTCLHWDSNTNLIWKHPPRHTKRWSFIWAAVVQSGDTKINLHPLQRLQENGGPRKRSWRGSRQEVVVVWVAPWPLECQSEGSSEVLGGS